MFRFLQLFKIPVDILLIFGAFLSAYHLRDNAPFFSFLQLSGNNLLPWENYQDFAIQGSVLLFLMLVLKGFYSLKNPLKFTQAIPTIWLVTTAWLMIMIAYFFFTRQLFFSRLVIVYIYLFVFSYLVFSHGVFRSIEHSLKAYGFGRQRVLFVGTGKLVERLAKSLNRKKEYTIIGSLDRVRRSSPKNTVKIIDSIDNIEQVIDQQKVDHIIQTNSKLITVHDDTVFEICRDKNIKYSFIPDIMELYAKNIETKDIDGLPLIEMKPSPLEAWGAVNKAIFDKTAALFGLIALSPLFAIIATLIKIDSQ
ncbi:MAG: hypothetical protein U9Q15_03675 [Patescibacteria group bacterium]|nr:hypothetical protein [Patescibacteria group bacterium]